jgi:sulfatase maturation enzyme AslB (radical SAM superfamily)
MERQAVLRAWARILAGYAPNLSIEITRECPLRCPGCYAYGAHHLGPGATLRALSDFKGMPLIDALLRVVRARRPVHLSLLGGEPLVRVRELEVVLPVLTGEMGIHTQVVTSAAYAIPPAWAGMPRLQVVVSVDGLQPEHDSRRHPATYERILRHITGQRVTIHCTLTRQHARPRYVSEFVEFWGANPNVRRIWFSLYTPQRGEDSPERLRPEDRELLVREISSLHGRAPSLHDMIPPVVTGYLHPPRTPAECIFSKTTACLSADFETRIAPCQFGGDPDCSQCGCMASVGLAALADHSLAGVLRLRTIFNSSLAVGRLSASLRRGWSGNTAPPAGQRSDRGRSDAAARMRTRDQQ